MRSWSDWGSVKLEHTSTPSVRWNGETATWRRSRSTWGRWSLLTNGTGLRGYATSCWPTGQQPTRPLAWRLLTWCSGGSLACPATWYSWLPQTRNSRRQTADLVERIHDIHHFARQHLKVAYDRMKTRYNQLANSAGFQEGDRVWLYRPTRRE